MALVQLGQECAPAGLVIPLEFAFSLGGIGPAEHQLDAQARTDALQRRGAVGRAVVDDQADGQSSAQQRLLEHALDVQRRLAQAERAVRHQPRGVVEQGHQVGLAQLPLVRHARSVHHVAVPDRAGELGGEAAPLLGRVGRGLGQPVLLEQAVHRRARQRLGGHRTGGLEQTHDLAHRAAQVGLLGRQDCLLQRRRELGCSAIGPGLGRQAVQPLAAPSVVPSLDGLLAEMAPARAGNGVLAGAELADQLLQLAARQPLAADQRAQHRQPEQRLGIDFLHRHALHGLGSADDSRCRACPPEGTVCGVPAQAGEPARQAGSGAAHHGTTKSRSSQTAACCSDNSSMTLRQNASNSDTRPSSGQRPRRTKAN
ncbi:hypothetical protein ROSA5918_01055 [Roseateles saccharophilus]